MRIPKKTNRYCPYCKKHQEHKISNVSGGHKRGTLKRGSIQRAKKRGLGIGMGNKGRWGSKPTTPKRKTKTTKKTNLTYKCKECGKTHYQKKGVRAGKIEVKQKGKP